MEIVLYRRKKVKNITFASQNNGVLQKSRDIEKTEACVLCKVSVFGFDFFVANYVLLNFRAVNGYGKMSRIHTVFVCPQLAAGVFTVGKTVYGCIVYGKRISCVVIVADFDCSLTCSAVVSVVERAVVYYKVGGLFGSCLSVKQDSLAVGVESATFKRNVGAAPRPYGILVCHGVFKRAVNKSSLSVKSGYSLNNAILVNQFITYNTVISVGSVFDSKIFERESRTALIIQVFRSLCCGRVFSHINDLTSVTLKSNIAGLVAFVCNSVIESNGRVF